MLDLDGVIFKEAHLEIFLIDLNGEAVPDVLDCEILADGFELRDEDVIGRCAFFMFFEEV